MRINKEEYSRQEILKRVGSVQQIAGAQRYLLEEGKGKGTSMIRMRNGTGMELNIISDRCLDIFDLTYKGRQLTWISKNGLVANHHFDCSRGTGWLQGFGGGLMVTCGLRNVGPPVEDESEIFGLHGKISSIPAVNISLRQYWENDTFHQEVSGESRECNVFGENLVIYRTIHINSDEPVILLHDRIVNESFDKEQLMILYHINWGFPLFSEKSELIIDPLETRLRGGATMEPGEWKSFSKPLHGFEEKVYFHELKPNKEEMLQYRLVNFELMMGVKVTWEKAQLPWLTQWKMTGESEYVLGLEPGNALPLGRNEIRNSGIAEYLDPFQEKNIHLRIELEDL